MRVETERLLLVAWSADFLDALAESHAAAAALLGVTLPPDWPGPDRPDVLPADTAALTADPGELGYGILPGYRGRGYATEVAGALVRWALGRQDVRRVIARCEPGNAASLRVLEKLGLEQEGERDGLLCFALER